jgi:hypothetical protein
MRHLYRFVFGELNRSGRGARGETLEYGDFGPVTCLPWFGLSSADEFVKAA